jgi:hypothetical protein
MTLEYGLLLGVFGTLITIVAMMIAYVIGYNVIKPKPKKEPSPLDDLFKADRLPDDVL